MLLGVLRCIDFTMSLNSGDANWRAGCSQEHPALKKKKKKFIYNSLNFLFVYLFKKNRNTLKQNQEYPQNFYAKQILN